MYLCRMLLKPINAHMHTHDVLIPRVFVSSSTLIDRTMIRICRTQLYCRYHEMGHLKSASRTGICRENNSRWIGSELFWWNRQYTGSWIDTWQTVETDQTDTMPTTIKLIWRIKYFRMGSVNTHISPDTIGFALDDWQAISVRNVNAVPHTICTPFGCSLSSTLSEHKTLMTFSWSNNPN